MKGKSLTHHLLTSLSLIALIGTGYWFYLERDIKTFLLIITPLVSLIKLVSDYVVDPEKKVEHSIKIRKEFEDNKTAKEITQFGRIVIRNIKKISSYPNVDDKEKGISPWFRLEFNDLYHNGVEFLMRIQGLVYDEELKGYRGCLINEQASFNAYLVGRIPFSNISKVQWSGDEYEPYPHVYCHFNNSGEPYEELIYCEKIDGGPHGPYFREVVSRKEVIATTKKKARLSKNKFSDYMI